MLAFHLVSKATITELFKFSINFDGKISTFALSKPKSNDVIR